jgi:hypothetical protein
LKLEGSQSAETRGNLRGLGIDGVQFLGLVIRKEVHGFKRDVEAVRDRVDGSDVDRFTLVRQLPARSTLGRVPALDGKDTTDGGERGQFTEGGVLGDQAVFAVGAGNVVQRSPGIVVKSVVANDVRRCDGKECRKRDDDGGELHCESEDAIGECALADELVMRMPPSSWRFYIQGLYENLCKSSQIRSSKLKQARK